MVLLMVLIPLASLVTEMAKASLVTMTEPLGLLLPLLLTAFENRCRQPAAATTAIITARLLVVVAQVLPAVETLRIVWQGEPTN
jgi:hypothetical protein